MEYAKLDWKDGQPFSRRYGDIYYSSRGAIGEFRHVFFRANALPRRWRQGLATGAGDFTIAEIGLGTATNLALTIHFWLCFHRKHAGAGGFRRLRYVALERHPLSPDDISRVARDCPALGDVFREILRVYPPAQPGRHRRHLFDGAVVIDFHFDDAERSLGRCHYSVDAWYMDGFSPSRNIDCWSPGLCRAMAANSRCGATLATYSAAGMVRRNLAKAGFSVVKRPGHADKREMISARLGHRANDEDDDTRPEAMPFRDKPWFSYRSLASHDAATDRHAAIIGAGIAGLTTAWSLSRRGWRITLVDRAEKAAAGASGNSAGLVLPRLSADPLERQFFQQAFSLACRQLAYHQKHSDERFWYPDGCFQIMKRQRYHRLVQADQRLATMSAGDHAASSVVLGEDECLLFHEQAGVVRAKAFCRFLFDTLFGSGSVNRYIQAEVEDCRYSAGRWELYTENHRLITRAPVLVGAQGFRSDVSGLTSWLPLQRVRGQLAECDLPEGEKPFSRALCAGMYLVPTLNDRYVIGASYEPGRSDPALCLQTHRNILSAMKTRLPESIRDEWLSEKHLKGRVSFRMTTPDRLPVIGAIADLNWCRYTYRDLRHGRQNRHYAPARYLPGLFVTTGHGSFGLSTAFLAADMIASWLAAEAPPVTEAVSRLVHPSRFVIHQLKRGR